MSLAKYLIYKGVVKKPSVSDMPHKGKRKSEDKEICPYAEKLENGEGEDIIRAMTKKKNQKPY